MLKIVGVEGSRMGIVFAVALAVLPFIAAVRIWTRYMWRAKIAAVAWFLTACGPLVGQLIGSDKPSNSAIKPFIYASVVLCVAVLWEDEQRRRNAGSRASSEPELGDSQ